MIGGKELETTRIFTVHVYVPNVFDLVPVGVQAIDYLKPEHIPEHSWSKTLEEQDPLDARSYA
jgi:hypothetical protein